VIVDAEPMRGVYKLVDQVARGQINVLVTGETGVGKEVIARAIHTSSKRVLKPFLGVNCGALAETLLQSELFGHEKGAFTGAVATKLGLLESANGGTVFLDEIGEMPLALQASLLRVLEERSVTRLGAVAPKPIDVRFVAATNRALEADIASGRFRKDLFFRLAGVTIEVPPLRKRPHEIEPLARYYVQLFCEQLGRDVPELPRATLAALTAHDWPGNVRELRNVIERAVLLCGNEPIRPEHLPDAFHPAKKKKTAAEPAPDMAATHSPESDASPVSLRDLKADMQSAERERIQAALDACAGNQTRAAEMLGISRRALTNKLNQYGFARPRKKGE
jgi:DNA-binding NtrC family response regulator